MMYSLNYCEICQEKTPHSNNKCGKCLDREERQRIAEWKALTIEEKFDDLRKRIEELERGPARF